MMFVQNRQALFYGFNSTQNAFQNEMRSDRNHSVARFLQLFRSVPQNECFGAFLKGSANTFYKNVEV